MRSVFKYWNLNNIMPYVRWLEHPMSALLTARGCTLNCAICGGSREAYQRICGRARPVFRSPERLAQDVNFIRRFSRAPIFVIHDIRMGGMRYARRLLELLKRQHIDNEMVFELFGPADEAYFEALHEAVPRYSLELTLESHDPELRRLNGKFPVSNERVEATMRAALLHGCQRLDVFFMVGLPFQSPKSALDSVEYSRQLYATFSGDRRIQVYIAPLAPFLDPGSRAFEDPGAFGYRLQVPLPGRAPAAARKPTVVGDHELRIGCHAARCAGGHHLRSHRSPEPPEDLSGAAAGIGRRTDSLADLLRRVT